MKSLHREPAVDKPTVGFAPLMELQPVESQRLEGQEACYREVGRDETASASKTRRKRSRGGVS